jgi:hypothetical protein
MVLFDRANVVFNSQTIAILYTCHCYYNHYFLLLLINLFFFFKKMEICTFCCKHTLCIFLDLQMHVVSKKKKKKSNL